jgi:hypothetical protein
MIQNLLLSKLLGSKIIGARTRNINIVKRKKREVGMIVSFKAVTFRLFMSVEGFVTKSEVLRNSVK